MRGVPRHSRSDNGPEFVAKQIDRWLKRVDVRALLHRASQPMAERLRGEFHSRVRHEFLSMEIFESLATARKRTPARREDYKAAGT